MYYRVTSDMFIPAASQDGHYGLLWRNVTVEEKESQVDKKILVYHVSVSDKVGNEVHQLQACPTIMN